MTMLEIDGMMGEGGGQVLRTALALSATTNLPFRIDNIRRSRSKPGLMRQHLTCVQAAAAVCGAEVRGAELRSTSLTFTPRKLTAGDFDFAIGSAGSTTLVLQSILPALLHADGPSRVRITGGTHNPMAPTVDFLRDTFAPLLGRLGPQLAVRADRLGFYPAGGGELVAEVTPAPMVPFDLLERGDILTQRCEALVAHVGRNVARRELQVVLEELGWPTAVATVTQADARSDGPGNVVTAQIESEQLTETFTAIGQRGIAAEDVARDIARQVTAYLSADAPVGEYLADQWVLLLALAAGGSFRTGPLSLHTTTQIELIPKFLEVDITTTQVSELVWEIVVES